MDFNATFIVSAVSFIIFVIIMNSVLYRPILGIMKDREEYINKNKDEADEHNNNSNALIDDKNQQIGEAHRKSRDIVAAKSESVKHEKSRVLNDAKSEMGSYVNSEKENLANQKNEIYYRLKGNIADLANNITTKLVGEGIDFEPLKDNEVDEVIRKHA